MAVQTALTHALNQWKTISPKQYPNGAVVFCSEEFSEVYHPPTPLKGRLYNCGSHFSIDILQDAINFQLGPVYGLIVVDGSDAAFGKAQGLNGSLACGPVISELGCLNGNIAGRTRRGGQSAVRFSRNREGEELAFLRKVSERAAMLLADVQGVVLGGRADMKQKLLQELPESLRKNVLCIVDLACAAGPEALRQAAWRAAGSAASSEDSEVERVINHFFELTVKDSMCCYGEGITLKALEMGAVEHLLLATEETLDTSPDTWRSKAASYGTEVVEIHPRTEQGSKFCKSFVVGGCLRWPLDLDMLQEADEEDQQGGEKGMLLCRDEGHGVCTLGFDVDAIDSSSCKHGGLMFDPELRPIIVAGVESDRSETLRWFEAKLNDVLDDPSSAEAIVACVEVVLSDEETPRDEVEDGVLTLLSAEGVPAELALELISRW